MAIRALLVAAWILLQVLPAVAGFVEPGQTPPASDALQAARRVALAAPLAFTPNAGQWDQRVLFGARTGQGDLFFLKQAVVLALPEPGRPPRQVRLEPLGMEPASRPVAGAPTQAVANYFIGNDPANWRLGLTGCDAVRYEGVYPGIDLRFHGDNRALEYDFLVSPGADPKRIRMRLAGANSLRLDADGSLVARLPGGRELRQVLPAIYQDIDGQRRPVSGRFVLKGRKDGAPVFGFAVAAYDPGHTLVIDPTITDSRYLGGMFNDSATAMTVDAAGAFVYLTGTTLSSIFPGDGSTSGTRALTDVFVLRFATDGTAALTQTVLVGNGTDTANAIAVDATGVYITGSTTSSDFPVAVPLFASRTGTKADAFITKLALNLGSKIFSTYFGGSGTDSGNAIAVSPDGSSLFVAGTTDSTDLPVKNARFPSNAGLDDGFVLKLRPDGSFIHYATYFGGAQDDNITALAISDTGDAYFAGDTMSTALPVNNPLQARIGGGKDAFAARLSPTGAELVFSTWLGGSGTDYATALLLDTSANIYLTGATNSTNFPVQNALYATKAGGYDAFLTKIDKTGRFIAFSTLLGGLGDDIGRGLAVDLNNDGGLRYIYLGGQTASANFPVENYWTISAGAYVQNGNGYRGAVDGFVTKFDPNGLRIVHSSYLGGVAADAVNAVATTSAAIRTLFVTGATASPSSPSSTGFPVVGPVAPDPRSLLGGGKTTGTPPLTSVVDVTGQTDPFLTTLTDTGYSQEVPTLALGVASAAPQTGATATINLTYADAAVASLINGISTEVTYDAAALDPLTVTTTLGAAYQLDWQNDGAGTLRLTIIQISGAPAALPAGTLATLTFRVKYSGTSTATMLTNTPTATDTGYHDVMLRGVPGLVTISQHCSVIGDCDCSGTVKIWEVQMAAHQLLTPATADMCMKTDYVTMTPADMQQIINSHLYRAAGQTPDAAPQDSPSGVAGLGLSRPAIGETAMTTSLSLRTGGESISIVVADIAFDSSLFSDVAVAAGPGAQAAGKDVTANVYEPGKLRVAVLGLGNRAAMTDGTIANLTFTRRTPAEPLRGRLALTGSGATPAATAVSLRSTPMDFPGGLILPGLGLLLP